MCKQFRKKSVKIGAFSFFFVLLDLVNKGQTITKW